MLDCYFKKYFFIDCPSCGMQRAIESLFHGEILKSISFNAALIPLMVTFLILIFQLFFKKISGGKWIVISFSFSAFIMFAQLVSKLMFNNFF
jgi:hypothetical protein